MRDEQEGSTSCIKPNKKNRSKTFYTPANIFFRGCLSFVSYRKRNESVVTNGSELMRIKQSTKWKSRAVLCALGRASLACEGGVPAISSEQACTGVPVVYISGYGTAWGVVFRNYGPIPLQSVERCSRCVTSIAIYFLLIDRRHFRRSRSRA